MSGQKNSPGTIIDVTLLCVIASAMLVFYIMVGSSHAAVPKYILVG